MKSPFGTWRAAAALALALGAALASAAAFADADAIRKSLHEQFPQLKIEDVRSSEVMPGWYEVFTGSQLVYSDATADHLFVGKLIDTHTKKDLAAEQLESRLVIDFQKLPLDSAIKIVKGDGSRRLALFEDPDCPYCQQLEHELASVNNVTLYVFLFPLAELHPQARVHAHAIWCAQDRGNAWTHWMLEHKDPGAADCKADPIDQLQALGNGLNVSGTPTFFFPNGKRVEGVVAAAKMEELVASSQAGAATTVASGATKAAGGS